MKQENDNTVLVKQEVPDPPFAGLVPTPQTTFLQTLIDSKKLPAHVKTVADAFTIAQMGKELGFPTMQAMHYIIPIEGKLTLSAKAINALLRKGGVKFLTLEDALYIWQDGTTSKYNPRPNGKAGEKPLDRRTVIRFIRDGIAEDCEFSMKDAITQELAPKSNWIKMPKEMLYARCLARGANRVGADLLLGLYMTDEIADTFRVDEKLIIRSEDGFIESIKPAVKGQEQIIITEQEQSTAEDIPHEEISIVA